MSAIDELLESLKALSEPDRARIEQAVAEAVEVREPLKWVPNPGPQTEAYFSEADELLYGGEPGGGKTDLSIGLALTRHKRSLIMRRQYTDLGSLIERTLQIHGSREGFNGSPPPKLRTGDRAIDFGAAARIGDEQAWQGRAHDLLAIDETTQFAKNQIRMLMGWLRSEDPRQKCRAVFATNPALNPEGLWVNEMFAPWLDPTFPNPAKQGELRWYVSDDDGNDKWVEGPGEYEVTFAGRSRFVQAKSRTFIASGVKDNPYYVQSGYQKQLDNLPEPIRSILLGGFKTTFKDHDAQVIPTAWIRAAIDRWHKNPPEGIPMCAIGVDSSGGGDDPMAIAMRHDGWFAPVVEIQGKEIPIERAGTFSAGVVLSYRRDSARVIIDMGGGYGSSTYEQLKHNGIDVESYKGAEGSVRRTSDGLLGFKNRRTEIAWRFREALDPAQPGGSPIMLPNDPMLISDLTSLLYKPESIDKGIIELEPKKDLIARLGRSTNKGDAVLMSWSCGPRYVKGGIALERFHKYGHNGKRPQVIMGRGRGK